MSGLSGLVAIVFLGESSRVEGHPHSCQRIPPQAASTPAALKHFLKAHATDQKPKSAANVRLPTFCLEFLQKDSFRPKRVSEDAPTPHRAPACSPGYGNGRPCGHIAGPGFWEVPFPVQRSEFDVGEFLVLGVSRL